MKYLLFLLIFFSAFYGYAQLSEVQKHELDSVYRIAIDTTKSLETRLRAYNRSSWNSVYKDYELGQKITSEYLTLAKSSKNKIRIAKASHFKGYTEMMLGENNTALNTYQVGLRAAINSEDKIQIAQLNGDLGNLMFKIGKTDEAIEFHQKCLEIADLYKLTVQKARARINLGEIYETQGKYKQSLQMFQEALSICIDNTLGGFLSSVYVSLGDVNLSIKEYEIASKNYESALNYTQKFPNINRVIQSLQKLGILNQELDRYYKAEKYLFFGFIIISIN